MKEEDKRIIEKLCLRSEDALADIMEKYGRLGIGVAKNILGSREDAEECVSDALGVIWEKIPPENPDPLLPYFLRIVRNKALNRRRAMIAQKRSNGDDVPLDETIAELIPFNDSEENSEAVRTAIDEFLGSIAGNDRILFIRRYWFEDDIGDIASLLGITENHARVRLTRLKAKLKKYLKKEGIDV